MAKIKTMTLEFPVPNFSRDFRPTGPDDPNMDVYRIKKVTDSIEYQPGRLLLKSEVEVLCRDESWKITAIEAGK